MRVGFVLFAVFSCLATAGQPNLTGSWTYDAARSQGGDWKSGVLTIKQGDDDVVLRQEYALSSGKKDDHEIRCNTMGKECSFKDDNEAMKVSMWHNGPKLVVMETKVKRDIVRKMQFGVSEDGSTLTLEITPIAPAGDKQTLVFARK